jgi:peroxiredoxin Q/BCP
MRVLMLMSLVVACAALVGPGSAGAQELKPGDPAPDFSLPGSDGKTYRLGDFKGRQAVVVAWFPRAFTSGCTAECKSMKETGPTIRQFDVAYFAASVDEPQKNKEFAESLELDFPILSDPGRSVARAYGVVSDDTRGATRWTFYIGRDGRVLFIDKQVKTATHGQDIAARLKELGIPLSH